MKITLVGMGSGAPGSLTAAGLETMRGAELIIGARPAGKPARGLHGKPRSPL